MKRLLALRHGLTEWNRKRLLQGQEDIPLSDEGRQQAIAIGAFVARYAPDMAVTSDLARTRETATLAGYPQAVPEPLWREHDLGEWTGRATRDLIAERPEEYQAWRDGTLTPPAGETFADVERRVEAGLARINGTARTVLVVTHGGVIRALCAHLLRLSPESIVPVDPASLTVIDFANGPRLRHFNLRPVIGPEEAPD